MDCDQIRELLDAYALGAAEPEEAASLEEHVADCVRCWSSLDEAQRAAASIALSAALKRAPAALRRRVLAAAGRSEPPRLTKLLAPLPRLWPAGVGVLAAAAVASLAFALFLQTEVSDLRNDNDQLAARIDSANTRLTRQQQALAVDVETTGEQLSEQQQLMAVLVAPDVQSVRLLPSQPASPVTALYHWSETAGAGALFCQDLPPLELGQVYGLWFLTEGESYAAGSFEAWDGIGQLSVNLTDIPAQPVAIGVSIDQAGAAGPGQMLLFAELEQ